MRFFKGIVVVVFLFVLFSNKSKAQTALTLKYFGLTIHPSGDPMAHLQPNRLDPEAHFVLNAGLFVGYEKFVFNENFSVKAIQGLLLDCSNGRTSVTHFGIRATLLNLEKHGFNFAIGPTFIVRESWSRFGSQYESSGFFNEHHSEKLGDLQYKLVPYGFEFEYDYKFNPNNQLSVSFTPGLPIAGLLSIGWKHYFKPMDFDDLKMYVPK